MVLKKLWKHYEDFAKSALYKTTSGDVRDITYWRDKIYITFSIYFIPISFIALIPGVWMALKDSMFFVAISDLLAAFTIAMVIFNRKISLSFKKIFVVSVLYLLALMLISTLGLFGPGIIYLYAITVFTVVMISSSLAYWSIGLHFITCLFFGLIVYYQPFDSVLFQQYAIGSWIAFSSNLIFLCLISVVLISKIINGLEGALVIENNLTKSLLNETLEKDSLNKQLAESERHFKSLFMLNPLPMWVFDMETLKFLEVNEAATRGYGYTEHEFLQLSIIDIKKTNDLQLLLNLINKMGISGDSFQNITTHYGKNFIEFPVEVRYNMIFYKGKKALLGIAKNISEQVKYTDAIRSQNKKLRKIGYIQSHLVRAPLARILGLVGILTSNPGNEVAAEMIVYLDESANELDDIIRKIIKNTDNFEDVESFVARSDN
jgi:PAS domain S-box-containing protein